jgi:F-type H+-transporting ATPase subunit b
VRRRCFQAILAGSLILASSGSVLAAEKGEETNIFNADIGNFIFTLVIFGAVVFILRKFAWKPLLDVLSKRETTIREAIEAAQRERAAAERLLTEYKAQLDKAREESAVLVAEGRRDAEAAARRVHEQARRESEEILARARREIQLAADSARKELHDEAAELAVRVAGRIIQKQLTAADHRALVTESLKEMQSSSEAGMN